MAEMWLLLKIQLLGLFGLGRVRHQRDRGLRRRASWRLGLYLFLFVLVLPIVGGYCYLIAYGLDMVGQVRLLPVLAATVVALITLFTSAYKANGVLFAFRDYDLVMALPVRSGAVVASRVLFLYSMNLFITLAVMLPAGAAYAWFAHPAAAYYPLFVLLLLFMPLLPIVLGCLLGALISRLSAGFRRMQYMNILLMVFVLASIVYLPMMTGRFTDAQLASMGLSFGNMFGRIYPLANLYGRALTEFDWLSAFWFALISAAAFVAFTLLVGYFLSNINTAMTTTRASGRYVEKPAKVDSPLRALYFREIKRYFASTIYVLNTSVGLVMALLGAIALRFGGSGQLAVVLKVPKLPEMLSEALPLILALLVAMVNTTGSSISLEGKSLWLIKSLPVSPKQICWAKMMVSFTLTVPAILIIGAIAASSAPMTATGYILLFATPLAFALFIALLGLLTNLKIHRFDWTNEIMVVKQSAGAMIPMFAGMLLTLGALFLVFAPAGQGLPVGLMTFALAVVIDAAMLYILNRYADVLIQKL